MGHASAGWYRASQRRQPRWQAPCVVPAWALPSRARGFHLRPNPLCVKGCVGGCSRARARVLAAVCVPLWSAHHEWAYRPDEALESERSGWPKR